MTTPDALARDTARLFAFMAAPVLATCAARAVLPDPARSLQFAYPPPTGRLVDAGAILASNLRVAALVIGATILAATVRTMATPLALLLGTVAGLNVAMVCTAVAADGARTTRALLPHAPVELLAYSLAGAAFLHARRHGTASHARALAVTGTAALALLAFAAVLEVTPL